MGMIGNEQERERKKGRYGERRARGPNNKTHKLIK